MTVRSDDITTDSKPIISVKKNKSIKEVYDVKLIPQEMLQKSSSFEVHAMMYPYSREVNASHVMFLPYEEYAQDILQGHKSAYESIPQTMHKSFGMLLGFLITAVFVLWYPSGLFSVDSIVSIFAAYFIGKELWGEIENTLVRATRNGTIRFIEQYFRYRFEPNSTLAHYSNFAKKQRYTGKTVMAEYMDFSRQSNSQTLRMKFASHPETLNEEAHLFSLHIDKEVISANRKKGFLLGFKLCKNNAFFGCVRSVEWFQSIHNEKIGCLHGETWIDDAVFQRITYYYGRIKWVRNSLILHNCRVIQHI